MRPIAWILFLVWAGLYAWSIVYTQVTPPTGDGWGRGLNRVTGFYGWQIAAGVVALIVWRFGRQFERASFGRWAFRLPVALAALLFLATAGVIGWANYSKPAPQAEFSAQPTPTDRPAAKPAEPVDAPD